MSAGRPSKRGRVFRCHSERQRVQRAEVSTHRVRSIESRVNEFRRNDLIFNGSFNEVDLPESTLGSMDAKCQHCNALHFRAESVGGHYNICCHNGIVSLPEPRVNEELKTLFSTSKFMEHIRSYNSAMAFASMTCDIVKIPGKGVPCFKIHGQIHR